MNHQKKEPQWKVVFGPVNKTTPMHIKAILVNPSGLKQNKTRRGSCWEEVFQREWKDTREGNGVILTKVYYIHSMKLLEINEFFLKAGAAHMWMHLESHTSNHGYHLSHDR